MNTIFLVTGATPKHVQFAGQWFANRVANVYPNPEAVGNAIPEMPVAVLVEGEVQGVIPALRKLSKSAIVHVHVGASAVRKAQGSERFYHLKASRVVDPKDVQFLMRLEGMWREEKALGRPTNARQPITVP
jgi:hypothetical protein